jgi:hypothetical protein
MNILQQELYRLYTNINMVMYVCVERSQWTGHVVRTIDNRIQKQILEQSRGQRRYIGMAKCRRMPPNCSIPKNWHAIRCRKGNKTPNQKRVGNSKLQK